MKRRKKRSTLSKQAFIRDIGANRYTVPISYKKGIWIDFTYEFMIARGLSKPAIFSMNFFHPHKALINLQNNVIYLHKMGIKKQRMS